MNRLAVAPLVALLCSDEARQLRIVGSLGRVPRRRSWQRKVEESLRTCGGEPALEVCAAFGRGRELSGAIEMQRLARSPSLYIEPLGEVLDRTVRDERQLGRRRLREGERRQLQHSRTFGEACKRLGFRQRMLRWNNRRRSFRIRGGKNKVRTFLWNGSKFIEVTAEGLEEEGTKFRKEPGKRGTTTSF